MAVKKMNRKRRGAKKGRKARKARRNAPTTTIVRSPGFTDTLYCKLKYATEVHFADGLSASTYYSFRGNSLYDPDYTGTGHQPMYFDQYSAIYNRYRVMGAKIEINAINASGSSATYFVLQSGTDTIISANITELLEQSRAKISKVLPISQRVPIKIKSYVSTRKACGLNKKQIFDEDFSALTTSSPNQIWYFNMLATSINNTSPLDFYFMATITYYVQFFDRKTQAQS